MFRALLRARNTRAFIFTYYYNTSSWHCQHIFPKKIVFLGFLSKKTHLCMAFRSYFFRLFRFFSFRQATKPPSGV